LFSQNFFLDHPKDIRDRELRAIINEMSSKLSSPNSSLTSSKVIAINHLRGHFLIKADGMSTPYIEVFFTMTPENNPRVQDLEIKVCNNKK
jgi:hypothetical protein